MDPAQPTVPATTPAPSGDAGVVRPNTPGVVIAAAHLAAGIGVLGRRSWARITGLVLAVLGLAANLIGLISVLVGAGATRQQLLRNGVVLDPIPGIVFGAVIFVSFGAAYFFVLITLARRGRDFA